MADPSLEDFRVLQPQWNYSLVAASVAISLIGAFTSTQLMCSARLSKSFLGLLTWTMLGSFVFGFCSIWCLHEVAMLACEFDVPIGINTALTILSALLATVFTFFALVSGPFWVKYGSGKRRRAHSNRRRASSLDNVAPRGRRFTRQGSMEIADHDEESGYDEFVNSDEIVPTDDSNGHLRSERPLHNDIEPQQPAFSDSPSLKPIPETSRLLQGYESSTRDLEDGRQHTGDGWSRTSSSHNSSRRSSSHLTADTFSSGLRQFLRVTQISNTASGENLFAATLRLIYTGFGVVNVCKGFVWSLALTSMHYVGILGLKLPSQGYIAFNPLIVILSGLISWIVCTVGCILMAHMETNLGQQLLFSFVATVGVAAMHFTGMQAATFRTTAPPSETRGYPPGLVVAVATIAIVTCLAANFLLAHSATVSRNKLAEIFVTRRKLWHTIAQKEAAEAAATARADFIASASHEIRTPLHHLQGYSDLLARTEMSDEGRMLLHAIQGATKTLLSITNNVLDWSRLENNSEATYRPVNLDLRTVCDSLMVLLPNKDEEADVELMVVVTPDTPRSLFLDEAYVHRILMNLLSNALKFTRYGYILLVVEIQADHLVATVEDTGCGVPPEFLPHMFQPFKQAQTRGTARGTGLGLSIIRQLLEKIQGTISVESNYSEPGDFSAGPTGSKFTVKIPVQLPAPANVEHPISSPPNVAIFEGRNKRAIDGMRIAWEKFGFAVTVLQDSNELSGKEWKYVWADILLLQHQPSILRSLLAIENTIVLMPHDGYQDLQSLPALRRVPHIVPVQRPLRWHALEDIVAATELASQRGDGPRTVRFAPKVQTLSEPTTPTEPTPPSKAVILVVEDNPVCPPTTKLHRC